jgi:hypothetical protein|tara:strand:+ start:90 stop:353 length:264 start_codon:yes stop_codon:yes gene_type:complete
MTKYLTKRDIIRLNNKAIRTKKNRSIRPDNYKVLRDTFKYPIIFSLVHNDIEMRVNILFGGAVGKLETFWLDMDFKDYDKLPTAEVG